MSRKGVSVSAPTSHPKIAWGGLPDRQSPTLPETLQCVCVGGGGVAVCQEDCPKDNEGL